MGIIRFSALPELIPVLGQSLEQQNTFKLEGAIDVMYKLACKCLLQSMNISTFSLASEHFSTADFYLNLRGLIVAKSSYFKY